MWEARAADGRGAELHRWVHEAALPELRGAAGLLRTEVFTASGDRVLLITWWAGEPLPVPDPPGELLGRPVHRWSFTSEHVE
ncbi:hypothetical protein [Kitasatospora atroaurantiaca]|uniref:Antibiotic biosynthesis monooxygenase n=1 Tax=Kitasatospora atroaurantiaca TaxID=285545 RepID=A0A561EQA0_9ACTN|nr:hypothetical protein [Kitasatospora atroaurantiaca]TWE17788.1 hypothetical protein FB465_2826 [Kitasatospora atroaurantiaca]